MPKIKVGSGKSARKIMDDFYEDIKDAGYPEVALIGANARTFEVLSMIETRDANRAIALIGTLIKVLSEQINEPSYKIAKHIAESLKEVEDKIEEERGSEEKGIHITINS